MIVLGIDPGVSGAWAVYDTSTGTIFAADTPTVGKDLDAAVDRALEKLLQEFYELNANGVFSLPDANYALVTATAAALDK